MSSGRQHRSFGPRGPGPGEFHEAVLGLTRLAAQLDGLLADTPDAAGWMADAPESDVVYALLGLFSVRRTFALSVEAMLGGEGEAASADGEDTCPWSREHLR
jgi:hypothetical protein